MRTSNGNKRGTNIRALTQIELLVIVGVVVALTIFVLPTTFRRQHRHLPKCTSNLRQVGIAFQLFSTDYEDKYPMRVSTNDGGSMEHAGDASSMFRHFSVMSNELNTPSILICPKDDRTCATNFASLRNANLSYFVGLDTDETSPNMLLSGDRNLTLDGKLAKGIMELRTNQTVGWAKSQHYAESNSPCGYVVLADGSVQRMTSSQLREQLLLTRDPTNRIALPQ